MANNNEINKEFLTIVVTEELDSILSSMSF